MNPEISVIIPAYNEAGTILETITRTEIFLNTKNIEYEVIVVDDGSSDLTALAVQEEARDVILIEHTENKGKGAAIQSGVKRASGNLILFMDADRATDISELPKLLQAIERGAEIAIGSRREKGATIKQKQPLHRIAIGVIGNALIQLVLGLHIKDTQCGFKLFKKRAAKELFEDLQFPRWSFDYEILYKAKKRGFKITEVPVTWEEKGDSKFKTVKDTLRCTYDLFKIRWTIK